MVKHGETKGRIVSSFRLVEPVAMLSFDKFYQILCFTRGRLERCHLRNFATKKRRPAEHRAKKKAAICGRRLAIAKRSAGSRLARLTLPPHIVPA